MTNKKKVLIVTQEMTPYIELSTIAKIARHLPQHLQEKGMEIRILMPKFGTINERRHRLHEVVRLSGINIIIDEDDFPLIIKVASLPKARMQVYFLDNEDFYKRKTIFTDNKGKFYNDNAERMIFFCKGVLETVKKFGWPPDIIHCHGWMTSLLPLYIRTAYNNDPLFQNAKIVYSLYKNTFEESLGDVFAEKALINRITEESLAPYAGTNQGLDLGALHYSDAAVKADEELEEGVLNVLNNGQAKPTLEYATYETEKEQSEAYRQFYTMLLGE